MKNNVKGQSVKQKGYKRVLQAVLLFLKIVWRKFDRVEVEQGKWVTLRIDWNTAWNVAKGIWLS